MDVTKTIAAMATGLTLSTGAAVALLQNHAAPARDANIAPSTPRPLSVWGSAMPAMARDRQAVIRRCALEARDAGRPEIDPACLRRSLEAR